MNAHQGEKCGILNYSPSFCSIGQRGNTFPGKRAPMPSRILVINDDQSILDLFSLLLEAEGYEVIISRIAYEEVSDVDKLRPALIILDFKIDNHNAGWTFLQKLKMYRPTKDIPLILCTAALNDVRELEETLRQKGIPVIYKPFEIDELLLVIQQLLPSPPLRVVERS